MKMQLLALMVPFVMVAGCASAPPDATASKAAASKDERCMVTGSNLPKRDCKGDVVVLPATAVDQVLPVLPSSAPRN
jgi:nitrous oxide reductase accessory protein NosL